MNGETLSELKSLAYMSHLSAKDGDDGFFQVKFHHEMGTLRTTIPMFSDYFSCITLIPST